MCDVRARHAFYKIPGASILQCPLRSWARSRDPRHPQDSLHSSLVFKNTSIGGAARKRLASRVEEGDGTGMMKGAGRQGHTEVDMSRHSRYMSMKDPILPHAPFSNVTICHYLVPF